MLLTTKIEESIVRIAIETEQFKSKQTLLLPLCVGKSPWLNFVRFSLGERITLITKVELFHANGIVQNLLPRSHIMRLTET